jgi:hypothetical protein
MRIEPADRGRFVLASALTALAVPVLITEYRQNAGSQPPSVAVQGGDVVLGAAGSPGTNSSPAVSAAAATQPPASRGPNSTGSPPTPPQAPAATGTLVGRVSFREFDNEKWGERSCAAYLLPLNTRVELTNANNGRSSWCVVREQRELGGELVLAVDTEIFDELDDRAVGVATVRLSWSS